MASAELSRRVEKAVAYPPLSEMGDLQRREFQDALLDADAWTGRGRRSSLPHGPMRPARRDKGRAHQIVRRLETGRVRRER